MTRHTKILYSTLLAIISLGGFTVGSTHALTYQDTLDTSFTFNSSIAITLSSSDLVISELTPNTYADSNIITITAASNNPTGYEVTATAGNGTTFTSTSLIDSENNSNPDSFTSLGTTDSYDISSNDFGYGKWGYTYSTDSGTTWINANGTGYSGLPYYGNTGASIMSSNAAGSSNTDFKIGAKATATQSAGTYNNVVNFAITANPVITTIYMQDLDATSAATLLPNVGDTATVYDSRDEQSYTIGKLADNNYWMLDNLALDLTNSTVLSGMTQDNTNASNTTLGYLKGTSTGTTSDQYATAAVANWTSSYSYSAPLVNLTNKDVIPTDATSTAGGWKVGGYYNYCAASAGSYCYGNGASQGASSGDATEDICPKGWRMPTGKTSGEFSALANAIYGSTSQTSDPTAYANYRAALRLPLSGSSSNGSANYQGRDGGFWSSTRNGNNYMYYLSVSTSYITPASYSYRYIGYSVRCVLGS